MQNDAREKYEPNDDDITAFIRKWVLTHRRSPLSRHPELIAFLIKTAMRNDYAHTLATCRSLYGEKHTPSTSALSRLMTGFLEHTFGK